MSEMNSNHLFRIRCYAEITAELINKGKLNADDPIIDELKTRLIEDISSSIIISTSELGAIIDKEFDNLL